MKRALRWLAICAGALLLAACATPQLPASRGPTLAGLLDTSGRIGLTIDSQPPQQFSAGFDLKGNAGHGELTLTTPLGNVLARINWDGAAATLKTSSEERSFTSLDALLERVTGAAIPAAALFDWLAGADTAVPDWQPDLSRRAEGRITARRRSQPAAELRVVFEKQS